MSDGGLTVLDGTRLRTITPCLPQPNTTTTTDAITVAELIEIAETEISSSFHGFSLPENIKSYARKRINLNSVTELDREQASSKLREYVLAIADELKG